MQISVALARTAQLVMEKIAYSYRCVQCKHKEKAPDVVIDGFILDLRAPQQGVRVPDARFALCVGGTGSHERVGWQGEEKDAPPTQCAFYTHLPAQPVHNAPHNRQPQSIAFHTNVAELCEWNEQAHLIFWRDTGAVVAHPETHHVSCRPSFVGGGRGEAREKTCAQLYARRCQRRAAVLESIADIIDPHFFNPRPMSPRHRPCGSSSTSKGVGYLTWPNK